MEVLRKDIIRTWILPHLSTGTRGLDPTVDPLEVDECILYKLKTGCQWRLLPLKQFFTRQALTWSGVYYHFSEWRKDGSWKTLWVTLLRLHKSRLDLSSVQLDGSHTRAHNGGAAIGYQGCKAARTTNLCFWPTTTGSRSPMPRRRPATTTICSTLRRYLTSCATWCRKRSDIEANIGHNPRSAPSAAADHYFDAERYRQRTPIERTNAWLDSFKTLLVRYETNVQN